LKTFFRFLYPRVLVVFAICIPFAALSFSHLKQILVEGSHVTPIEVSVVPTPPSSDLPLTVTAVSPWGSSIELTSSNGKWYFPEDSILTVSEILLGLPDGSDPGSYRVGIRNPEDPVTPPVLSGKAGETFDPEGSGIDAGQTKYRIEGLELRSSLFLRGVATLNWKGDLRLLFKILAGPAVNALFLLLIFLTLSHWRKTGVFQKGAVKTDEGKGYVFGLDQLRGLAVLLVFFYHAIYAAFGTTQPDWSTFSSDFPGKLALLFCYLFSYGWSGVAIFFAVSGFCIQLSWMRSSKQWSTFFLRRAYRIIPPYWLALALFAFAYPLTRLTNADLASGGHIFSHILLLHNLDPATFFGVNGSFWSIGVEWQLYLIFPVLVLIAGRLGWTAALITTAVFEIGIRYACYFEVFGLSGDQPIATWLGPLPFWLSWAVGAQLADSFFHGRKSRWTKFPIWFWPLLLVAVPFLPILNPLSFLFAAMATTVVIARLIHAPDQFRWIPSTLSRHLANLGLISYSFYLLHQPLLNAVPKILEHLSGENKWSEGALLLLCLLTYPGIFALTSLFYRWVELPAIAAGKLRIRRLREGKAPLKSTTVVQPFTS
jgi:peptidoglycan/LPS O-acetylase OafA/YrhL